MSIKSIFLLASLFWILSSHNAPIGAKCSPNINVDDKFESAQTRSHMSPLFDHKKDPFLAKETIQPHTNSCPMKVQNSLKDQDITDLLMPSLKFNTLIDDTLIDDYNTLRLANSAGFSLTEKDLSLKNELSPVDAKKTSKLRTTLKESSFIEKIEKALVNMNPDLPSYHWNQMLD